MQEIVVLRTPAYIFVSPGDAPAIITQYVAWVERPFSACQTSCSMYPPATVSQLFEPQVPKIAVFTYRSPHFCFLWGRPWGNHAKYYMDGKKIRLAECAHLTITVSQIERDIGRKSSFFHTPLHSTPPLGRFPPEHRHPVWYGKPEWCGYQMVKKFRRYLYSFWRNSRT